MATLRARLANLLLAQGHDAIDRVERPDSGARQLVRDIETAMQRARGGLVQALATAKSASSDAMRNREAEAAAKTSARRALAEGDREQARSHAGLAVQAGNAARESGAAVAQAERAAAALREQLSALRSERLRAAAASMRATTAQVLSGAVASDAWTAAHERKQRLAACQAKADAAMHVADAAGDLMRDDAELGASDTAAVDALLDTLAAESGASNKEG